VIEYRKAAAYTTWCFEARGGDWLLVIAGNGLPTL
jgi:hypothetical protein